MCQQAGSPQRARGRAGTRPGARRAGPPGPPQRSVAVGPGLQRGAGRQAPEAGRNDQLTPPFDAPENRHHLRTNATDRHQGEPAPCRPPTTRVPRPPLRRLRPVTTA
ncbi:hypothetical protein G6F57_018215 [Rhizopus arrhizus]|nr:hypothetical protein G6F57_018215 [Rhizopus arrhizus]